MGEDDLYGDEYLNALLSDDESYQYEESEDLIDQYMDLYDSLLDIKKSENLLDDETLSSLMEIEDLLDEYENLQNEYDDIYNDDDEYDNLQMLEDYMDYYTEKESNDDKVPNDAYLAAILSEEQSNDDLYFSALDDDEENVFVDDKILNNLPNNAWVWQLLILSFSLGVCSCLCYYATKVKPSRRGQFDFGHNKKGNYSKVDFESANSAYDHNDVIDHESDIELIEQS